MLSLWVPGKIGLCEIEVFCGFGHIYCRNLASFCCLYCQLWTYFTLCSSVSIVNFEHVIAGRLGNQYFSTSLEDVPKASFKVYQCSLKEIWIRGFLRQEYLKEARDEYITRVLRRHGDRINSLILTIMGDAQNKGVSRIPIDI